MKKLLILFTILTVIACKEKSGEPIIGLQFKDYKKTTQLANYNKVSDTTLYYEGFEPEFSLLHLSDGKKELVLFSSIWDDSLNIRNYTVLDTLTLSNPDEEEILTIGYCEIDIKNQNRGNIIALVENTDTKKMFVTNIQKAWVANSNSKKIEQLRNTDEVDCFNEWYDGEERKINYDLLND